MAKASARLICQALNWHKANTYKRLSYVSELQDWMTLISIKMKVILFLLSKTLAFGSPEKGPEEKRFLLPTIDPYIQSAFNDVDSKLQTLQKKLDK